MYHMKFWIKKFSTKSHWHVAVSSSGPATKVRSCSLDKIIVEDLDPVVASAVFQLLFRYVFSHGSKTVCSSKSQTQGLSPPIYSRWHLARLCGWKEKWKVYSLFWRASGECTDTLMQFSCPFHLLQVCTNLSVSESLKKNSPNMRRYPITNPVQGTLSKGSSIICLKWRFLCHYKSKVNLWMSHSFLNINAFFWRLQTWNKCKIIQSVADSSISIYCFRCFTSPAVNTASQSCPVLPGVAWHIWSITLYMIVLSAYFACYARFSLQHLTAA